MRIITEQRRDGIRKLLLEKEHVTIKEVMDQFHISVETARRDFNALSEEGFLDKVYGGAALRHRAATPFQEAMTGAVVEGRQRVADRAVRFMKPGDTIFLDNSVAVYHMCDGLMNMNLTVLTNSLAVVEKLSQSKTLRLFCIGGRYDPVENAFVGPLAVNSLSRFQFDRVFFSCKSLDPVRGIGSSSDDIAEIKRVAMQCAVHTDLLVDHTKFDSVSFSHFATLDDVECLFTDHIVTDPWRSHLDQHQVRIFECCENGSEPPDLDQVPPTEKVI